MCCDGSEEENALVSATTEIMVMEELVARRPIVKPWRLDTPGPIVPRTRREPAAVPKDHLERLVRRLADGPYEPARRARRGQSNLAKHFGRDSSRPGDFGSLADCLEPAL